MKKLHTTPAYKSHNQRRAEKSLESRLRHKNWVRSERQVDQGLNKYERQLAHAYRNYKKINAPSDLTFLGNTEEVISFVNTLKRSFDKKEQVFVVLRPVKKIDYDAIVVLLSIMVRFKSQRIPFNGDFPKHGPSELILRRSGFFNILNRRISDENEYAINPSGSHIISTHASKTVDQLLTAKLIEGATETIWENKRRCQGVQTTLIELMQNTFGHADPDHEGEKHWWLSVNHSTTQKTVRFSFVDYGIGIFRSLKGKTPGNKFFNAIPLMLERFRYKNNAELLELILQGELHKTVTGDYFRGQGLPGIRESMDLNWFSNFHIISNDVHADVSNGVYTALKREFSGTFIYFEINSTNRNHPLKL